MSHFDKAILEVLRHEGGYVNHPNDPGGETNFGITKRDFPGVDIKNLTKEAAIEIYRRNYWKAFLDTIPSYAVAAKWFDMMVNMGHSQANKLVQRAAGVEDDGVVGNMTLSAVRTANPMQLVQDIVAQQKKFYTGLAERKPSLAVFLKGWMKRASWIPKDEGELQ